MIILKKSYIIILIVIMLSSLSGCSISKQQKSVSQHENMIFTCTPTQLFRCEPKETSCMTIPIVKTLGTVQIIVDLAAGNVKSLANKKVLTESTIDSVQVVKQLVYLSGKGIGFDKTYRSWHAIINRQDGSLYSSSITTGAGHVIYGECHEHD